MKLEEVTAGRRLKLSNLAQLEGVYQMLGRRGIPSISLKQLVDDAVFALSRFQHEKGTVSELRSLASPNHIMDLIFFANAKSVTFRDRGVECAVEADKRDCQLAALALVKIAQRAEHIVEVLRGRRIPDVVRHCER